MTVSRPYSFISCAVERWKSPWLSHQPLNAEFMKEHNVLYLLHEPSLDQVLAGWKTMETGLVKYDDRLFELLPPRFAPRLYFSKTANAWSQRLRAWNLRRTLKGLGWENKILYLWHPRFRSLIGKAGERLSVFHIHDHYPGFYPEGSVLRAEMERLYQETIQASDVVIACGQALFDDVVQRRGTTGVFLVENGVSFELLRSGRRTERPAELRDLKGPLIGYIGRLNSSVNFRVLESIARGRPDWSVVVMGPKLAWSSAHEAEFERLVRLPNVRYVEGRRAGEIGAYFDALDVGLIAYERDGICNYRFPLKMVEYFAFGKPVVSIRIPSIEKFASCVRLVDGDNGWIPAIEEALRENDAALAERRIETARNMDWSRKSADIVDIIDSALAGAPDAAPAVSGRTIEVS